MVHLLNKIQGWVQNGPMGNALQKAKIKPSKGSWGIFGASKGSKAGTIRRAAKAGVFTDVTTSEGDIVSGWQKSRKPEDKKEWSDAFLTPTGGWKEKQWEEPFERKEGEFVTEQGTGLEGTGLENIPLPSGIGATLGAARAQHEAAELSYNQSLNEADVMELEGKKKERAAEKVYDENMAKLGRAQGQTLTSGVQQEKTASAAGSQSGFQYSGPVERLKSMGQEQLRTGLEEIESQKRQVTAKRDTDIDEAKGLVRDAETTRETAESDWTLAEAQWEQDTIGIGGVKDMGLDLVAEMEGSIIDIVNKDRELHSTALSKGGAGHLWDSPGKTTEYSDLMDMIDTARGALEGWSGTTDFGDEEGIGGDR